MMAGKVGTMRAWSALCLIGGLCAGCSKGSGQATDADVSASADAGVASLPTPAPGTPNRIAPLIARLDIFEKADSSSRNIGYLRLGQSMARTDKPVGGDSRCAQGYYGISPNGFVCANPEQSTTDLDHPVLKALSVKPDLSKPMPYLYGFVRRDAALWHLIPNKREMDKWEYAYDGHLKEYAKNHTKWNKPDRGDPNAVPLDEHGNAKSLPKEMPVPPEVNEDQLFPAYGGKHETPWWLSDEVWKRAAQRRKIPNVSTYKGGDAAFYGRAYRHAGLAVIGSFPTGPKSASRKFVVTLDGRLIGEDKIKPHYASSFHGVVIDDKTEFPFAIVRRREAVRYDAEGDKQKGALPYREIVPLTGKKSPQKAKMFWQTKTGYWVKEDDVGVITNSPPPPTKFDYKKVKWIDIGIAYQTLTAYEGEKPVYATLISSGRDGDGDPYTTHSTVRGEFPIKWKHITATMDNDDPENRFELRDVPWVQYFEANFALHGAYWHDDFGRMRSHGCVNMAPIDARRLFFWTDPPLPDAWHAVRSGTPLGEGTWVRVRR